jgi:hypothetical protein
MQDNGIAYVDLDSFIKSLVDDVNSKINKGFFIMLNEETKKDAKCLSRLESVSEEDIHGILDNIKSTLIESFKEKKPVRIPHFGTFKITTSRNISLALDEELKELGCSPEEIRLSKIDALNKAKKHRRGSTLIKLIKMRTDFTIQRWDDNADKKNEKEERGRGIREGGGIG